MTNQGHIAYRATVPIRAAATEKMAFASNNNQCSNRCFFLTTTYTASRSCLFHSGSKFPCGSAVVQQNHYKMSTSSLLLSKFTRLGCWYLFWNNNGFQLTLIRHNPSSHDEINTMQKTPRRHPYSTQTDQGGRGFPKCLRLSTRGEGGSEVKSTQISIYFFQGFQVSGFAHKTFHKINIWYFYSFKNL